jgi:hypothetical protein
MVTSGSVDVVVVWHVDRLVRKLADLEDVIERCERSGVRLATVSGDIDLSTDAGRLVGRILASVARGEVERKSARQKRAARQRAEQGHPVKWSHRSFGFAEDKVTQVPTEAKAISDACDQLLAGSSLRSVARLWREAGHTPPQRPGSTWKPNSVRTVLRNPRIAALSTYRGEIVGSGDWPAIVPEETWRAVSALLADPSRADNHGPRTPRTLLGGQARCGRCDSSMYGGKNSRGQPIYRCIALPGGHGGHVARLRNPIDEFVSDLVVDRLSRPDAADLLVNRDKPGTDELHTEANTLRARRESIAVEFAEGELTGGQLRVINERIGNKLRVIENQIAEAGKLSVLAPLVRADDVRRVWDGLDLDRRRAVIAALFTVTLHSPGRGARGFNPDTVRIQWKTDGS